MSSTTQVLSAADLNLTVTRSPKTANVGALVADLRTAVRDWDALNNSERADGGKIRAAGGKATRYVNALLKDHGANLAALKTMVAERKILTTDDNAVVAAIFPDRYQLGTDGELIAIDPDAKPKPKATAKAAA